MSDELGNTPHELPDVAAPDNAETAIAELASQSFHAIAEVWNAPWSAPPFPSWPSEPWIEISRRILACGAIRSAVPAMKADLVVGRAIESGLLYVGLGGTGHVLQPKVLPLQLVQSACQEIAARAQELTERTLVETAASNLRKLRRGISGEPYDGWLLTAFRGISLLPEVSISTPWGKLAHAQRVSSEMWYPQGCSVVLATPMLASLRPRGRDSTHTEDDLERHSIEAQRIADLVSYGLALGSSPDDPTTAVSVGSGELLPTGMTGWSGPVRVAGFHSRPSPISRDEATAVAQWMSRLNSLTLDRVEVALRRLVRGLAERVDHVDSLIDAVIAWENLVECRDEPTRSVLYGISKLVGTSWPKRRIQKVYEARSEVVHGESPNYNHGRETASDALRIGLDALRSLIESHEDKLEMTSASRVTALGFSPRVVTPPAHRQRRGIP